MADNLQDAAVTAYTNCMARWEAGTLKGDLLAFAKEFALAFQEDLESNHPPLNWSAVIQAASAAMDASSSLIDQTQISQSAQYVFNVCWLVNDMNLTPAQQTATLAAYNAWIE